MEVVGSYGLTRESITIRTRKTGDHHRSLVPEELLEEHLTVRVVSSALSGRRP
jgi:hypothetical protein